MALSLDDILAKSGDDPVIQDTLQKMLGRTMLPTQTKEQTQQERSPEGVPYSLQANPDETQEVKGQSQAAPAPSAPAPSDDDSTAADQDDEDDDSEDASDAKASVKVQAPAASKASDDDYNGEAPITEQPQLDFGSADQNRSGLSQALQAQRDALAAARIQHGAEQVGAGFARLNPDYSYSEEMAKQAGLPVEQYKALQADQMNDPTSGISKGVREYMKKFGLNVADGATAAQISQVAPYAFKNYEAQQAQAAKSQDVAARLKEQENIAKYRQQMVNLKAQDIAQRGAQARQDRLDKQDYSEGKDVLNQINALKASSRSGLGQASLINQKADRLKDIVNSPSATPQDMASAATDLNSMISQSTTMSGTQHQMYNNLATEWTNAINFLTNSADPVQVPKVKAHLSDIAQRMQNLSQQILSNNTEGVKKMHPGYEQRHPGQIDAAAKFFTGSATNSPAGANPQDAQAIATIKKNNPGISDEDAQSALQKYKITKGMP